MCHGIGIDFISDVQLSYVGPGEPEEDRTSMEAHNPGVSPAPSLLLLLTARDGNFLGPGRHGSKSLPQDLRPASTSVESGCICSSTSTQPHEMRTRAFTVSCSAPGSALLPVYYSYRHNLLQTVFRTLVPQSK
jgi:hypothetical protein